MWVRFHLSFYILHEKRPQNPPIFCALRAVISLTREPLLCYNHRKDTSDKEGLP